MVLGLDWGVGVFGVSGVTGEAEVGGVLLCYPLSFMGTVEDMGDLFAGIVDVVPDGFDAVELDGYAREPNGVNRGVVFHLLTPCGTRPVRILRISCFGCMMMVNLRQAVRRVGRVTMRVGSCRR